MNCKALLLLIVLIVCKTLASSGQSFNKAKADSLFDALAHSNKVMMTVAISKNGNPVYSKSIGYVDYNSKTQANADTKYRIGSVTKMFTAAMIFQLIEEGKLTLETPLSKFYPKAPGAERVTIAYMLNHSSGIPNFTADANKYASWFNLPQTHEQMIARMLLPLEFEPGEKNQYSNSNFVLLGYIIEKIDQEPYAVSVKKRIINKLKLKDTYYGNKIAVSKNEAQSFKWIKDTWEADLETDMSIPAGAGALVSTPTDLNKFMEALFKGEIVSNESLVQMKAIKNGFGMNLRTFKFAGHVAYGHSGEIDSFQSQSAFFPEEGIALSHVANGVNTNVNEVMRGLLSILFNKPYVIPKFE